MLMEKDLEQGFDIKRDKQYKIGRPIISKVISDEDLERMIIGFLQSKIVKLSKKALRTDAVRSSFLRAVKKVILVLQEALTNRTYYKSSEYDIYS